MLKLGADFFALFKLPYAALEHGRGILFEGGDYAGMVFILLTLIIGGTMAYAAGRAIASTWRPVRQALVYMLPLTAMVRFLHYALYGEELLSAQYFAGTFLLLSLFALWGYRVTRRNQMVRQYPWAFTRSGLLGWRDAG